MTEAAAPAAAPEAPAPAAPAAPAPTPPADAAPATPETPKPERTFSQVELDEIVERRLAKERKKRSEVETRLRVTEELALKGREKPADLPAPPAEGEPTREKYASYEEFIEARADWRADQKIEKKFQEREAKDRDSRAQSEQEKQREAFRKSMKESAKDIEDFDDVIGDIKGDDPVAQLSATAIEAAEAPGKMLYHLKKNPEEAERIASLPPGKQAREIVRLEEKLAKPPAKPSKAPEPIAPIGGKTTPADEMPDAAKEPDKWLKWRQADLLAKRKAGMRAS